MLFIANSIRLLDRGREQNHNVTKDNGENDHDHDYDDDGHAGSVEGHDN